MTRAPAMGALVSLIKTTSLGEPKNNSAAMTADRYPELLPGVLLQLRDAVEIGCFQQPGVATVIHLVIIEVAVEEEQVLLACLHRELGGAVFTEDVHHIGVNNASLDDAIHVHDIFDT